MWSSGVRHIATPISEWWRCVRGQFIQWTRTQDFLPIAPIGRIHYRRVVKEMGCPLDDYDNGQQMVKVVLDALEDWVHFLLYTISMPIS